MADQILFYSTTEVSRALGISSRTVQRMCHKGRIQFHRYEKKILIPATEITRLLKVSFVKNDDKGDSGDIRDL